MINRVGLALSVVVLAIVVSPSTTAAGATDPAWVHMVDIFGIACLEKFPDDGAVRKFATDKQFASLPDDAIHQLLGTDPGQGWIEKTERGPYFLTVEFPPFHTCAVRKTDTTEPDYIASATRLITKWAAQQSGAILKASPMQNLRVTGLPTDVYLWVLDRGPAGHNETLMIFVTRNEGKVSARLVRQIKFDTQRTQLEYRLKTPISSASRYLAKTSGVSLHM